MKLRVFSAALGYLLAALYTGAVMAQIDLSGNWAQISTQDTLNNGPGPYADDFAGIPINKYARLQALLYSGGQRLELQRQCEPWSANYWVLGPWGGRFTAVRDHNGVVIAWHVGSPLYDRLDEDIWMDGRAEPPLLALHTYNGFTTGQWEGNTLHTTSTHLKDAYLQRDGVPLSNQATTDMYFSRDGDYMFIMGVVKDPIYLEAPWVLARTLRQDPAGSANDKLQYCLGAELEPGLSDGYQTSVVLPPQEAQQAQFMKRLYNLPREATDGGPNTMYPEFARQIARDYKPPSTYCHVYCCMARPGHAVCAETD